MTNRFVVLATTAIMSAGLSACNSTTSPDAGLTAIGVIVLGATSTPRGYITTPVANFYKVTGATFLNAQNHPANCGFSAFDPTFTSSFSTSGTPALAGGGIATTVSGRTDSLKVTSLKNFTYQLLTSPGIAFRPGDSVKFVIQGNANGYPAYTVTGRTAEAFTLGPIDLTKASTGIPITWSLPADTNSAMLIFLRYAPSGSATITQQISCVVRDDGFFQLPINISNVYANATQQTFLIQRLRTVVASPSGNNFINIVSTFTVPTPIAP